MVVFVEIMNRKGGQTRTPWAYHVVREQVPKRSKRPLSTSYTIVRPLSWSLNGIICSQTQCGKKGPTIVMKQREAEFELMEDCNDKLHYHFTLSIKCFIHQYSRGIVVLYRASEIYKFGERLSAHSRYAFSFNFEASNMFWIFYT
jgi:hypothetical protein